MSAEDYLLSPGHPTVPSQLALRREGIRKILPMEVHDAVREVMVILETEVASALDITIGLSDNDGDSG